jgi:anti-sigma factor RsiW
MTNCDTIRENISSWLDGQLSPKDSESVRLHLMDCAGCADAHRQLEKLNLALKEQLIADAAPVDFRTFWRGVQQRIDQKRPWHDEVVERCRDFFSAPKIAWAVPAIIALVLAWFSIESYLPVWRAGARNNFAAVESIDAHGRSVALLRENESKTTVIWLYQDQEGENEAAEGETKSGPAF